MKTDTILISILEDGAIKMETDKISAANHGNCEIFLREIAKLAGGTSEVKHKHGKHHTHAHGEEHHQH